MNRRKALLEQVMADRLAAMGDEPSPEEVSEWQEGRLPEEQRQALLERAAVDPAFARQLLDGLDFPDLPAEQPWDAATRDQKWQRFTERMRSEGAWPADPTPETSADPAHRPAKPGRWLPLAASLFLGVLLGAALMRLGALPDAAAPDATAPEAAPKVAALRNIETLVLRFDDTPGDRGGSLEKRQSAEWIQLVFPGIGLPEAESYAVEVVHANGRAVHRQDGLVPGSGGRLTVLVAAEALLPGGYRARLFAGDDFEAQPVATATWTVTTGPS